MTMRTSFLGVLSLTLASALAQVSTEPPTPASEFKPGPAVTQPLPFSHKAHVALGVTCRDCHAIEEPGDFAGLPEASKCMQCHVAMMTESPHIKQ